MFLKQAIADVIIDQNVKSLQREWQNVVNSGAHFCSSASGCPFVEDFEWDPENFLYYRARAITANQTNGNGDHFSLDELKKSFPTFVGKGVYYNHESTKPELAFGIILDAVMHEYPDDSYVQILSAIDRNDINNKRPGLLNRIVSGGLKTTSMSVAVERCTCSVCGNVATRPEQLCAHMLPKQAGYVKGKLYNNKVAFEYNEGLTFLEDSVVETPADSTAYIFQIYSNLNNGGSLNPRLMEHLTKYASVRKSADEPRGKSPLSIDSIIEDQVNRKLETKVKQLTDEKIRVHIDPVLQKIEESVIPILDQKVEVKIQEKDRQLGLGDAPAEKDTPPERVPPKEDAGEPIQEKKEEALPEKKSSVDVVNLLRSVSDPKVNTKQVKYPKVIAERVNIGSDLSFVVENGEYVLYAGETPSEPKVSVPVTKKMMDMDIKSLTKLLMKQMESVPKLSSDEQKSDLNSMKTQSAFQEGNMKIAYTRGPDFKSSFFVAQDGDKTFTVSAAEIIPEDIQERITQGDDDVSAPDDIVAQLDELSDGSIEKLESEVVPSLKEQAASVRKAADEDEEKKEPEVPADTAEEKPAIPAEKSAMKKSAEFSWAESEIPTMKPGKPCDGPLMAVNQNEAKNEEQAVPAGQSSKVKSFYARLPNKGVGEPSVAINVQSSANDEVRMKIEALRKELESESMRRLAAEKALDEVKDKSDKKDKAGVVEEILDLITPSEEDKGRLMQTLNKFSPVQLGDVRTVIELAMKKGDSSALDSAAIDSLGGGDAPKFPPMKGPKSTSKFDKSGPKGAPKSDKEDSKAPKLPKMEKDDMKFDLDLDEKPKMKAEASLPQVYLSEDNSDMSLTQLAIKSLES
jgi:hypothetical protein